MAKKIITFSIIPFTFFGSFIVSYLFEIRTNDLFQPLITAVVSGVIGMLLLGNLSLSEWLFKARHWIVGSFSGLFFFLLNIDFSAPFDFTSVVIKLFSALFFGNLIFGTLTKLAFKNTEDSTPIILYSGVEKEIISDNASINYKGSKKSGRLILTNMRLTFIVENKGKTQWDYFFPSLSNIEIGYRFGIPNRICIPDCDVEFNIQFSRFWKKSILRAIKNQRPVTA